jgi:hypothetical protein
MRLEEIQDVVQAMNFDRVARYLVQKPNDIFIYRGADGEVFVLRRQENTQILRFRHSRKGDLILAVFPGCGPSVNYSTA